ncbi:unnamed protein product, partial [Staurois parvus]
MSLSVGPWYRFLISIQYVHVAVPYWFIVLPLPLP